MNISYLKALKVLNLIDKKKAVTITYYLLAILLCLSVIEATVISSIYPVIEYLLDQESLIKYQEKFNQLSNSEIDYKNFPIYFFICVSSLFLVSAILQIFSIYFANKVKEEIAFSLKNKALKQYFLKKMNFYEKNKVGDLIQRLLLHSTYCGEIVFFLVTALREFLIILAIYTFLLFLSLKYTIILTLFISIIGTFIQKFGKKIVIGKANQRNISQEKLFSISNIIISAMKIIRIYGKKKYFINLYLKHSYDYKKREIYLQTITNLPVIFLRFISFSTIIIFIYYITSKTNLDPAFYGVYFVAVYKINNSFGLLNNSLLGANKVLPSLNIMKNEISKEVSKEALKDRDEKKLIQIYNFKKEIILKKVIFSHQNVKKPTLKIKNLKIKKGNIIGLIGDSGSGKSTLLDILSGLKIPKKIQINIDNKKNVNHKNINFSNFAYCNQNQYIFPGTIKQNIMFFDKVENKKRLDEVINVCMLKKIFRSKSLSLNSKVYEKGNNLSGGQIQRIGLARTLYFENEIIFLDEALNNVESKLENQILSNIFKFVKKYNKTLVMVSHNLNFLKKVDQIINIQDGINSNKKIN
jgi:ABC-type bacteriocin/lantibiotic exporter with double-glycine peptidase domain